MPAAVCVSSVNRGRSPVHTWTHVGTGQCPRCFCLRFNFRCSKRAAWGSGRFCPSGMHSRRSSSPAREFERAQIDPDASEAPVSSMTYGKAALCRLLTLVVAVVVTSAVCIRIGRGAVAVAPRIRQYRAGWLPFSLHARWAWAQRRLFISALAKTSCLSGGFKSQLRKERKESHMQ